MPRMAFIGVRNSWLMLATNWLFARLAAWASAACRSSDFTNRTRSMARATWPATARINANSSSLKAAFDREPKESVPRTRSPLKSGWQA